MCPSSLPPLAVTTNAPFIPPTPVHNRQKREVETSTSSQTNTPQGTLGVSAGDTPIKGPTPENEFDFSKQVIFGSVSPSPPTASYTQRERTQRIDAYAGRVVTQTNTIERGNEGERNIKFQKTRQFLEPAGYFSGGLMAAGYDPHEKITVTFTSYKGVGKPEVLTDTEKRTYFAWEIAAGAFAHDKVQRGGPLNFQFMEIAPQDRSKVADLELHGQNLQNHWTHEIAKPMSHESGALAIRSGKADAYVVRGTLQSLANNKDSFEKLTPASQAAVKRTLENNAQVIIPNIYGYPLAGYAFIPHTPFDGNYEHRPNKGLMLDLKNGAVREIHGDADFANWAKDNQENVQRSFNASDRQGGTDAHWPKAGDVLNNLIVDPHATYPGYSSIFADKAVPVAETFNYTESRGGDYRLKYGNLDSGLAGKYQEVNTNNSVWSDQTEVFGSTQQSWKAAKDFWGNTFGYIPVVGNAGNIFFGAHDSIYGMTANDRVGGTAAAVISTLQLGHELATIGLESGLGKTPVVERYSWEYNERSNDIDLVRTPKVSSNDAEVPRSHTLEPEVNLLRPSESENISEHAMPNGEQLIEHIQPNAKGIYQVKNKTSGEDQWFIRYTDGTGSSNVYEIRSDFKLSDNYVQVINPGTRKPVLTVHAAGAGQWKSASGDGGVKWPWQRSPSPTPSTESTSTPKFSERFVDDKGSKILGAEKFDDYLNLDESKNYRFYDDVYEEGSNIKRKLSVSWTIDDGNFAVTEGERAKPDTGYSESFAPDLNREIYSIIKRENGHIVRTELDFRGGEAHETIQSRLAVLEETIPDADLRARISEVAHQGATHPAYLELMPPQLKDNYGVSAGQKHFIIEYDPSLNTHTVKATTKWVLKLRTEDGTVPNRDLDITSTRAFTIRESNELSGDTYTIDPSAPTLIEVSTPTHI